MTTPLLRPADVFMNLIVTFLTPMFLSSTGGDLDQARAAAEQTASAYTARDPTDLLLIAQAIALGLAVLSSISLSMAENLPINLILRLRGNATSLHRAAGQCRDALSQSPTRQTQQPARVEVDLTREQAAEYHADAQVAPSPDILPSPEFADSPATMQAAMAAIVADSQRRIAEADATLIAVGGKPFPERSSHAPMTSAPRLSALTPADECRRSAWSVLMAAQECATGIANLPIAERRPASMRTAALGTTSNEAINRLPNPPAP